MSCYDAPPKMIGDAMNQKRDFLIQIPRDTAIGIAGLALGLAMACILVRVPGNSAEWASWVQAVGSILAIVGAFLVARYQARKQVEHLQTSAAVARVSEGELTHVVAKDAMAAIFVANQYIRDFESGTMFEFDLDRLTDVQLSLRSLYSRAIPTELIENVITIQRLVTYSMRAVQQRNVNTQTTYIIQDSRDKAKARMQYAHEAVREIEQWLKRERSRLGLSPVTDLAKAIE